MNSLFNKATKVAKRKSVLGSFFISLSFVFISLGSFILFYLVAKDYGAEKLGVFGVFYSTFMMVSNFFDQGISLTTVHFYNTYTDERKQVLRETFITRLLLGLVVALPLYIFASYIAENVFHKPELTVALEAGAVAILTGVLIYFSLTVFRAKEMYKHFAFFRFVYVGAASIAGILLIWFWSPDLDLIMYLYSITAMLAFVLSVKFIDWSFLRMPRDKSKQLISRMLHYGKWAVLSIVLYTAVKYTLMFFISVYGTLAEVGEFSLAFQIVNGIGAILSALTVVLFSSSSKINTLKVVKEFLRESILSLLGISLLILLALVLFLEPLVDIFFGSEYLEVPAITIALFVAYGFFLVSFPLKGVIVNYHKNTKVIFYLDVLLFILTVIFCPYFLKNFGMTAGAWGYCIAYFFAYLLGRSLVLFALNKRKKS